MVERARIVLCAAEGLTAPAIAARRGAASGRSRSGGGATCGWGSKGLANAPPPGAPLTHGPEVRARLIAEGCTRPLATAEGARPRALDV